MWPFVPILWSVFMWLVVPTLRVRVGVEMAVVPDLKVALRLSVVSTWRGSS